MSENNTKKIALLSEVGREGYEASVLVRMQSRSGAYTVKGAPGNALEIMANDKTNIKNLLMPGTMTKLTKNPTATQVDAVTMKGSKVLERIQYKDTTSSSGIQKTLKQVESGKYRQTQLRGTTETSEKFNQLAKEKGITKRMESTGISSKTTKRVGDKFTKQMPKVESIGDAVKSSVKVAAGLTAGVEVIKSIANGDTVGECASHVVSKTSESMLTAAASTVAAEATFGVAASLLATSAVPVVGPVIAAGIAAVGAGAVVGEITDGLFDDIGDGIGNVVDNVADVVSDTIFNVGYFFDSLFI